jgi:hypothetical protein
MTIRDIDWEKLGKELRISADSAHDGDTPNIEIAYSFLLDNPECFGPSGVLISEDGEFVAAWPVDMPTTAPDELIAAYYGIPEEL